MNTFIQATINAVFQVVLFALIPLVWWLITARKKQSFFNWLGFKKIETGNKKQFILIFLGILIGCYALGELAIWMRGPMESADSQYKGMGFAAIPSALMYSFIQTGLSEEILFRGFILKRLANKFGFLIANIAQAAIFGSVHLLMVWGNATLLAGTVIVLYPMVVALLLSYINEKKANGSIYPSWIIHGLMNSISIIIAAIS